MKNPYTTKLRRALISVLLCSAAAQAQAFNITSTDSRYELNGVRYYFIVSNWTTADQTAGPCSKPGPEWSICIIGLTANRSASYYDGVGTYAEWRIPLENQRQSMGQILTALQKKGFSIPLSGSILVPFSDNSNNICISFTYSVVGAHVGGAINLFGPCARVIAPALQCEITGDTTVNHRELPDNKVDGAKASTQLAIKCRGATSVTVSASRTDSSGVQLTSDGSLYSKITVNGKDATTGINVAISNGQATPLNIESTLAAHGTVTPGAFSGSTVITISPP
ncbi:hypothetical protein [Pseudomonas sp. 2835]|uniref:MrpH family fimbial adhesin n=1 Tax=Pseudomonas sp. 2835 TaxID=3156451 RepID=UPI003D1C489D